MLRLSNLPSAGGVQQREAGLSAAAAGGGSSEPGQGRSVLSEVGRGGTRAGGETEAQHLRPEEGEADRRLLLVQPSFPPDGFDFDLSVLPKQKTNPPPDALRLQLSSLSNGALFSENIIVTRY